MTGAVTHGQATGMVTAIAATAGTIKLDHEPMLGFDWPAMTMKFTAKPVQLADMERGDKVAFEIDWTGKTGAVNKIVKAS